VDEPYDYPIVNLTEEGTIGREGDIDFVAFCAACPRLRVLRFVALPDVSVLANGLLVRTKQFFLTLPVDEHNDAFMQRFVCRLNR
jgi:hypothetical protein